MSVKHELIEHKNSFHEKHWAVVIQEGDYEGVVYQYDTVSFNEEDNGDVILQFNTITLDNPKNMDLTSDEFETIMGDILTNLINEQLANGENGTGGAEAPVE